MPATDVVTSFHLFSIHYNIEQWRSQRRAQGGAANGGPGRGAPTETSPQNFYRLWKIWNMSS